MTVDAASYNKGWWDCLAAVTAGTVRAVPQEPRPLPICVWCGAGSIYAHALAVLIEEFEDALPYVPDYFRQKWGYDESIAQAKAVLAPEAAS